MFLFDDLLLGPGKAAMLVFKELARKAQADWLDDDAVKQELQEIYGMVEAGQITTQEFEARECRLLERLEQIARAKFNDKWGTADVVAPPPEDAAAPRADSDQPTIEIMHSVQPLLPPAVEPRVASVVTPVLAASPPLMPPTVVLPPPAVVPPIYLPPSPSFAPPTPSIVTPSPSITTPSPSIATSSPPLVMPSSSFATPWGGAPVFAPSPPVVANPPAYGGRLTMAQVIDSASRAITMLNRKLSAITSVSPGDDGWRVVAELVERRGVPDTNDLLGVYELRLDPHGHVMRYERIRLRRRGDLQ